MVFRFLAVMIFGLLLLGVVRLAFDQHPRPASKVETPSDMRTSVARNPKYSNSSSPVGRAFDPQPPNVLTAGVEPDEPGTVSLSIMKVRLQRLGAAGLERMVRFDPEPLDQRADARNFDSAEQPISTEPFVASPEETIATASASPEHEMPAPPQEPKASQPEATPARVKAEEASLTGGALTEEQALHIKSRLRDLGFLSSAKSSGWDAGARNALRDFKVANNLSNDDTWDSETSNKLDSQAAVRAGHSIVGNWSTAPCRSAKPSDTRLSINAHRAKSSAGSVCEFRDLKATAREWRVNAACSNGGKRWTAKGRFSLTADKLVWTSGSDVISYFRCN